MKILMMAINDPVGMMIGFANAINRYTEHTARVISLRPLPQFQFDYDIEMPRFTSEDYGEIEDLLKNSDIFHFHMLMDETYQVGPFVVKDFIKDKGLLHHHHGIYDHHCFLGNAAAYSEKYRKLKRVSLVSTPDLLNHLPDATWQPNIVPIYDGRFLPRTDHLGKQDAVRLMHAPTRRWQKNSDVFDSVAKRLSQRYGHLETRVIQGVTYNECLWVKRSAHMVFDHMQGWFGISSLESLSHGIPVVAGLDDQNIAAIRAFAGTEKLPWTVARTESSLEKELCRLIEDPAHRIANGAYARRFMEQFWNEERVLAPLLQTYTRL